MTRVCCMMVMLGFVSVLVGVPASGQVVYVNERAAPGGDGGSWARAFDSLTDALAAAGPNDEVWVASGRYFPDPAAGRNGTFTIPDSVRVFGGFRGDEDDFGDRPDEPLDDPTVLGGQADNNYSVVTVSNTGSNTVLDGLVIEGGRADVLGTDRRRRGGGIFGVNAGPTLRGIVVRECFAIEFGGGVYLENTGGIAATIEASEFRDNTAQSAGGGVAISGNAFVDTSRFTRNEAQIGGGGMVILGNGVTVIDACRFDRNTVTGTGSGGLGEGGGLLTETDPGAIVQITGSRFDDNDAVNGGGGVTLAGHGSQSLLNSRLFGNDTSGGLSPFGGGLRLALDSGQAFVENCAITGNTSEGNGAGIAVLGDHNAFITNTTVAGNTSLNLVGGIFVAGSSDVVIDNGIVYTNTSSNTQDARSISISRSMENTIDVNRSLVEFWFDFQGPLPGTGTTDADPMFVNADGNDDTFGTNDDNVRLMPGSPAIDAGLNLALTSFSGLDVYGDPRFRDDTGTPDTGTGDGPNPVVDIGAAEFQGTTPVDCVADTNGNGVVDPGDFTAWVAAYNAGDPVADANQNGVVDPGDFTAWIAAYNAGCG